MIEKEYPVPALKDLCAGNNELYEAMADFLLLEPRTTESTFGTVESFLADGDREKAEGDHLEALVKYDCAARIACYQGDEETAKKALTLADSMNPNEEQKTRHKVLLANLDKVFEIAGVYYKAEKARAQVLLQKQAKLAPFQISR